MVKYYKSGIKTGVLKNGALAYGISAMVGSLSRVSPEDRKTDLKLAKRVSQKIKKDLPMDDDIRKYFMQTKSASFRIPKNDRIVIDGCVSATLVVKGKHFSGDEYKEVVPLLTRYELLEKLNLSISTSNDLTPTLIWNSLKMYGSLDAALRFAPFTK